MQGFHWVMESAKFVLVSKVREEVNVVVFG